MLTTTLRRLREARATELEGEGAAEAGFTLIELMVVLLIIAILLAIAIPTFLGVTGSANDRATQSNLTNALTEANAIYQNNAQTFTGTIQSQFTSSAPEFQWTTGAVCATCTGGQNGISYLITGAQASGDAQALILSAFSKNSGTCWYVIDIEVAVSAAPTGGPTAYTGTAPTTGGTFYAKGPSGAANCTATGADAFNNWYSSYSSVGNNTN